MGLSFVFALQLRSSGPFGAMDYNVVYLELVWIWQMG
jgi:hypothetical protein